MMIPLFVWFIILGIGAFLLSLSVLPFLIEWAIKAHFVDQPEARKSHDLPVPPVGGLGIGLLAVPLFLLLEFLLQDHFPFIAPQFLLVGYVLLLGVGVMDDRKHISPYIRFFMQFLAAFLVVVWGHVRIYHLGDLFGFGDIILSDWVAIPFSILCIMLFVNALNLMDGLDGLAGGIVALMLFVLSVVAYTQGGMHFAALPVVMLGCVLGFLWFNARHFWRKRAAIFLGDGGSLSLGFVIATYCIFLSQQTFKGQVILPPLWVAWILALPVMDAMGQFIRRITQGHHPFYPDRGHLHLLLVDAGWSVPRTVYNLIALCALYIMTGGIAIYLSVMNWLFMGLWLVVFVGHVFVALKPYRLTNFIEKHKY